MGLIIGRTTERPPISSKTSRTNNSLFYFNLEQEDSKIILHTFHVIMDKSTHLQVISCDTNIFILLLHYFDTFTENGVI